MESHIDSPEEFKRRLREHVRLDSERRFQEFPQQVLTWLAVAPAWPLRLAEQGFPVGEGTIGTGESVRSIMARTASAHFSESGDAREGLGGLTYWMNQSQRSFVINKIIEKNERGLDYVRSELHNAGLAMSRAAEKGAPLSPPLLRWIELARCVDDDEKISKLIASRVDHALAEAKKSYQSSVPEALRWIEAAEPFARIFKGPLELAVTRAGRKLELFGRRELDERLENYFVRREQVTAFSELISGPDSLWALHFVGVGGTGKTMLMRYISSILAPSPDYNLAVARVDFDLLNPAYPSVRPGLLLAGLAEELRAYADEFTSSSFKGFDGAILRLHEKFRGEASFGSPSGVSLNDALFREALDLFVVELNSLWRMGRRPVLILDTCEELSKIRTDGNTSGRLHVTFQIFEYIQERAPQIRVVFSGRRPLAWSGHNWAFSTPDLQQNTDVALQDPLDYLRLHEIRGFTEVEALEFLKRYRKKDRQVNPTLFTAILNQSHSSDHTFDSRFEINSDGNPSDTQPRYNPFELNMYASWSCEEPDLDASKLEKGEHYYVRERIVDRIHDRLKKYLPQVALLGRFDRNMMREIIGAGGDEFDILFPELIDQEWIDVDRVATQSGTVWAMDNVMRRRLLNYYEDAEHSTLTASTDRVGAFLYDLTLNRDWKDLTAAYFDSALRTLISSGKVKAADWWSKVEANLAKSGEWTWAMTLTDLLLAEGGPVARADVTAGMKPEQESVLRAAVLATRAAALTHLKPLEAKNVWLEVLEKADRHPTLEGVQKLKFRAMAGIGASLRLPEYGESAPEVIALCWKTIETMPPDWALSDPQCAASLMALREGLIEALERLEAEGNFVVSLEERELKDNSGLFIQGTQLYQYLGERVAGDLPSDLQIFILSLASRSFQAFGQSEAAASSFESMLNKLDSFESGSTVQHWLDWHRPDDLPARIRLQYIKAMHPAYLDVEATLKRVDVAPNLTTIDGDRLASALLRLRSWQGVPAVPKDSGDRLERSLSLRSVAPSCNVHREVPPYFASLLKTNAAAGFVDEVVRQGLNISKEAETKSDIRTQNAADRTMLRLAYDFRLQDEPSQTIGGSLESSTLLEDIDSRFTLAALDGAKSTDTMSGSLQDAAVDLRQERHARLAHIGWRCGRPLFDPPAQDLPSPEGPVSFQQLLAALELLEGLNSSDPAKSNSVRIDDLFVGKRLEFRKTEEYHDSRTTIFGQISFEIFSLFLDAIEASHSTSSTRERLKKTGLLRAWDAWRAGHATQPLEAITLYLRASSLTWGEAPQASDTEWRAAQAENLALKIGRRRAAEIALEEGTLLALRLPQYARIAFSLAVQGFIESRDNLGSLWANISLWMLYTNLQDRDAVRLQLERTHGDYIELRSKVPALPPWDELFSRLADRAPVSSAELTEFLDKLEGTCWRPWLVRLTGCLTRHCEFDKPRELTVALREWVEKNYSAVINEAVRIPAEFDSSFLYPETHSLEGHQAAQPWFVRLKKFVRRFESVFYGLVGLVFLVIGFGLLMRLVAFLSERFIGYSPEFWPNLIMTVGIIAVLSLSPRFLRAYMSLVVKSIDQTINIENDGRVTDPNRPLMSTTTVRIKSRIFRFFPSGAAELLSLPATSEEQYGKLSEILPEKVRKSYALMNRWRGDYFSHVRLAINERNAAAPWEAIFGLIPQPDATLKQDRLLFRRTIDVRTSTSFDPIIEPVRILSWAPDVSQLDVARNSWRNDKLAAPRFSYTGAKPAQQIQGQRQEVNVLHLIGTPIEAHSGIRLEIGEAEQTISGTYSNSENVDEASGATSTSYGRGFLVRADELLVRFSNLRVCIVQGAVLPEETSRTTAQRFEASKLRRFGADLAKCGIACVILLPPTTHEISIEVGSQIAELVSRRKSGIKHWMKTVWTIREIIAARGHTDKEAALEMALDVCVYIVDGFQFRSERA